MRRLSFSREKFFSQSERNRSNPGGYPHASLPFLSLSFLDLGRVGSLGRLLGHAPHSARRVALPHSGCSQISVPRFENIPKGANMKDSDVTKTTTLHVCKDPNCPYCIPCKCGHRADEHCAGIGQCYLCSCPQHSVPLNCVVCGHLNPCPTHLLPSD
jgi:hypothetical protein